MKYRNTNIFSQILLKKTPCDKVFEDRVVLAFKDIKPKANTHVLVIPKMPVATFSDFCEENTAITVGLFFKKVHEVARFIGVDDGFQMIVNNGEKGQQEVFHLHAHILSDKKPKV
ncbi:MAG: HIT domain-containing protein [Alphaproteobacteria bacterium]|nr:HIT domain-containing protein [Alphaproteobacteria bacterium]